MPWYVERALASADEIPGACGLIEGKCAEKDDSVRRLPVTPLLPLSQYSELSHIGTHWSYPKSL